MPIRNSGCCTGHSGSTGGGGGSGGDRDGIRGQGDGTVEILAAEPMATAEFGVGLTPDDIITPLLAPPLLAPALLALPLLAPLLPPPLLAAVFARAPPPLAAEDAKPEPKPPPSGIACTISSSSCIKSETEWIPSPDASVILRMSLLAQIDKKNPVIHRGRLGRGILANWASVTCGHRVSSARLA